MIGLNSLFLNENLSLMDLQRFLFEAYSKSGNLYTNLNYQIKCPGFFPISLLASKECHIKIMMLIGKKFKIRIANKL